MPRRIDCAVVDALEAMSHVRENYFKLFLREFWVVVYGLEDNE